MTPRRVAATCAVVGLLTACGAPSATSGSTSPRGSQPTTASEVAGPSEFFFIVDGPLVTNGSPWKCATSETECAAPAASFSGTIELLDDCIVVQGWDSPPGLKQVVIFEYGVTWDESTSTILGLGPNPVAVGDATQATLANFSAAPDEWTHEFGLPSVPDKVRDCMQKVGTDMVYLNTPWYGVGPARSTLPDPTAATT